MGGGTLAAYRTSFPQLERGPEYWSCTDIGLAIGGHGSTPSIHLVAVRRASSEFRAGSFELLCSARVLPPPRT